MIFNGKKYRVRTFTSVEAANSWLEKNPTWGVLKVDENNKTIFINKQIKVHVAKCSDRGIKVTA